MMAPSPNRYRIWGKVRTQAEIEAYLGLARRSLSNWRASAQHDSAEAYAEAVRLKRGLPWPPKTS